MDKVLAKTFIWLKCLHLIINKTSMWTTRTACPLAVAAFTLKSPIRKKVLHINTSVVIKMLKPNGIVIGLSQQGSLQSAK